ncbi:MAG: CopG family transcriptional regulator [Acidobacteria bacterium RIFCSPLOWO2_02_FULL_61_28]|nr:MAG: CopG family transcriptional regulator [Acidobacteria bacterium RIFCSPLOWO2_02_FULL_61_28]
MRTQQRRTTIYLEANLHRALRLKAAETDRTISEIVNSAVQQSLAENAEDLAAFETRAREPNLPFEKVLKDLKRRGLL